MPLYHPDFQCRMPERLHFHFIEYVLKDPDHARRALAFIEMHGDEQDQKIASAIRIEMDVRGWREREEHTAYVGCS